MTGQGVATLVMGAGTVVVGCLALVLLQYRRARMEAGLAFRLFSPEKSA
jgi:hypothetical protein